jgi:hypothetical protein
MTEYCSQRAQPSSKPCSTVPIFIVNHSAEVAGLDGVGIHGANSGCFNDLVKLTGRPAVS